MNKPYHFQGVALFLVSTKYTVHGIYKRMGHPWVDLSHDELSSVCGLLWTVSTFTCEAMIVAFEKATKRVSFCWKRFWGVGVFLQKLDSKVLLPPWWRLRFLGPCQHECGQCSLMKITCDFEQGCYGCLVLGDSLGSGFNFFKVSPPTWGFMIQFDEHIFQMGGKKPPTSNWFLHEFFPKFVHPIIVSDMDSPLRV